jgi:hypothetical protein
VVLVKDGGRMIGVAVTMFGVCEGITVQTENGWGETPYVSHAPRKNIRTNKADIFFMVRLYTSGRKPCVACNIR